MMATVQDECSHTRERIHMYDDYGDRRPCSRYHLDKLSRDDDCPKPQPSTLNPTGDAGGGDLDVPVDYYFWLSFFHAGKAFAKLPQELFNWRQHPRQHTRTHGRQALQSSGPFLSFLSCFSHTQGCTGPHNRNFPPFFCNSNFPPFFCNLGPLDSGPQLCTLNSEPSALNVPQTLGGISS